MMNLLDMVYHECVNINNMLYFLYAFSFKIVTPLQHEKKVI